MDWILFDAIVLLGVIIAAGVGVWALRRKTPMHFWSGTTVDPNSITDVKKYNAANAMMWFGYCVPMLIAMVVAPFSIDIAAIILTAGILVGLIVLIVTFQKITKKYTKHE